MQQGAAQAGLMGRIVLGTQMHQFIGRDMAAWRENGYREAVYHSYQTAAKIVGASPLSPPSKAVLSLGPSSAQGYGYAQSLFPAEQNLLSPLPPYPSSWVLSPHAHVSMIVLAWCRIFRVSFSCAILVGDGIMLPRGTCLLSQLSLISAVAGGHLLPRKFASWEPELTISCELPEAVRATLFLSESFPLWEYLSYCLVYPVRQEGCCAIMCWLRAFA